MIGKTISHYKIIEKLGEGGMGEVYLADDLKLERKVAIKFLPEHLTKDKENVERFKREAKAAAALNHPNIITIYEIAEEQDQTFIVMEYIDGESLRTKIDTDILELDEILHISKQICEGLAEAHKADIVHRDIKPENILINNRGRVKILDFGLAKLKGVSKLTKNTSTLGTIHYMSPEQIQGKEVDARSDIWSFGVVLYEMLTAQVPFKGDYESAIIYSILNEEPPSPIELRKETPEQLEQLILRALKKNRDSRYLTLEDALGKLESFKAKLNKVDDKQSSLKTIFTKFKKPQYLISAIFIFIVIGLFITWSIVRQGKIRWAEEEAIPEINRLWDKGETLASFQLALKAEKHIPDNTELIEILNTISTFICLHTDPPGANIYFKEYSDVEGKWKFIGQSPIDSISVPKYTYYRFKFEKGGYSQVVAVAQASFDTLYRKLDAHGILPANMVRILGRDTRIGKFPDFFIDKYEVTNSQYKEFLNAGGYQKQEFWKHRFVKNGQVLKWEEAIVEFKDTTGRPGPAQWQAGDYTDGQDNYPVTGISWYEAAAYAEFVGKSLPTTHHWSLAAGLDFRGDRFFMHQIMPLSNFKGSGPNPVGHHHGVNYFGVYDMAGNVSEWCWNESQDGRFIRGGAWNDIIYMYRNRSQLPSFYRSPKNGFRCVYYPNKDKIPGEAFGKVKRRISRDYYKEEPINDAIFQLYKSQFLYDEIDLKPVVEEIDTSAKDWTRQTITFNAAYGGERVMALLYLPRISNPPYQTLIYFPGAPYSFTGSVKDNWEINDFFDFHLKNGRAVMYPVYKGTYERLDGMTHSMHWTRPTHQFKDYMIKVVKDFRRCVDYLESRPDIDSDRLTFYGWSWAGSFINIICAVEKRLKTSILMCGGLSHGNKALPEVDEFNYLKYVTSPRLMLSGRYDYIFPVEISAKPMHDLLGTAKDSKHLILHETDHFIQKTDIMKETLSWLDKYLGPVESNIP